MERKTYAELNCSQIKALAEFFDLDVTEKEGFSAERKAIISHAEIPAFPDEGLPEYSGLVAYAENDLEDSQYGVLQLEE
jgi:mevalonate kinase